MALISCKECGQSISDTAVSCPHCGAKVIREVYCRKCGTKIPEDTKFCPSCGDPISVGAQPVPGKDKMTTALLAIFLGSLGIHYFYLGKTTAGILTIVLSLVSCSIWAIIMFIQGILILTMPDAEFNEKYVNTDKSFPLF